MKRDIEQLLERVQECFCNDGLSYDEAHAITCAIYFAKENWNKDATEEFGTLSAEFFNQD